VAALVPQILDALFTCLRLHEARWTGQAHGALVRRGTPPAPLPGPGASVDGAGYAALFREGLAALGPMIEPALRPPTLEGLRAAAAPGGPPVIPDALWAAAVLELAAAHRHATISRDHLVRAAVPLYLGRVASFAAEVAGLDPRAADERLEALCLQFERSRGDLVALWNAPAR
jgi:hypothetical protein